MPAVALAPLPETPRLAAVANLAGARQRFQALEGLLSQESRRLPSPASRGHIPRA
jgi:hypothetical protein